MMKKFLMICCLFFAASEAQANIQVFACEQEWGALARELVGRNADVVVALRAVDNPALPHEMKPALTHMIGNADFAICSGGGLEDKWLPQLFSRSLNAKIKSGENVLFAANYIEKLPPSETSVGGVARVHLNPHNMLIVAAEFTRRIKIIDEFNAAYYQDRYVSFVKKWTAAIKKWEADAKSIEGLPVVVNDDSWDYLIDWMHLKLVAKVLDKDGMSPGYRKRHKIEATLKGSPNAVIIFADFEKRDAIFALSKQTDTRVIFLPFTVFGVVNTSDLYALFDNTINRLRTDCSKVACAGVPVPVQR